MASGQGPGQLSRDTQDEIARLRAENEQLWAENEQLRADLEKVRHASACSSPVPVCRAMT